MKKTKKPVMVADLVKGSKVKKKKKSPPKATAAPITEASAYSFVSQSYTEAPEELQPDERIKHPKHETARERAHLTLDSLKNWRQTMLGLVDGPAALMLNREPAVFILKQVVRTATRTRNVLEASKLQLMRRASQAWESSVADRLRTGLTSLLHVRGPFRRAEV